MTAIGILGLPPDSASIVSNLRDTTALEIEQIQSLVAGVTQDTARAAFESGGEPLVVVPKDPGAGIIPNGSPDVRTYLESILEPVVPENDSIQWYEHDAAPGRSLNTVLDGLAEVSNAASVAVIAPLTPFVQRRHVDTAAMRLRSADLVVGPATDGCGYFIGRHRDRAGADWSGTADLDGVVSAAQDTGEEVDWLPILPSIGQQSPMEPLRSILQLAAVAEKPVAPATRSWLSAVDLSALNPNQQSP